MALHFYSGRVATYSVNLNGSKSLAILRGRASPTAAGFVLDSSIFGPPIALFYFPYPRPFDDRVQSFDAGVEMLSLGERERALQLIQAENRAGVFGPQWRPCNVAHGMLVGIKRGDPDGEAQSEWDRSQL